MALAEAKKLNGGGDDRVSGLYASGDERQPESFRSRCATDSRSCSR